MDAIEGRFDVVKDDDVPFSSFRTFRLARNVPNDTLYLLKTILLRHSQPLLLILSAI